MFRLLNETRQRADQAHAERDESLRVLLEQTMAENARLRALLWDLVEIVEKSIHTGEDDDTHSVNQLRIS